MPPVSACFTYVIANDIQTKTESCGKSDGKTVGWNNVERKNGKMEEFCDIYTFWKVGKDGLLESHRQTDILTVCSAELLTFQQLI